MTRKVPWIRVLVEGVVIVASILLALGVDAWWTGVQDDRLATAYVSRIERDLRVDSSLWSGTDVLVRKRAALDGALTWLRSPDFTAPAVEQLLSDLTMGAQRAYGLGITAERSTFDELISTGSLQLLDSGLREALLRYHRSVDFARARLIARETTYAAKVYELTPRQTEGRVRTDLTSRDQERISRRALAANLEGPLIAERNVSQLRQGVTAGLLSEATDLLALIRASGAF